MIARSCLTACALMVLLQLSVVASDAPGTLVSTVPLISGSALPSAARNVLLVYRTVATNGQSVEVSGTLAIPHGTPPPGGWPMISWAHGTTGNAPQCAPSRFSHLDGEQRLLDWWVAHGYAVAQTDYEGEGTPGVHPYFVAIASAHDVTDIVRAARYIDPQISTRWVAMGHSEGGAAVLATAAYGPQWAPELKLLGVVSYAPASHLSLGVLNSVRSSEPELGLPFIVMMIKGILTEDSSLHAQDIFSSAGLSMLPDLSKYCVGTLMHDPRWTNVAPRILFRAGLPMDQIMHDFDANEPSRLRTHVPVLLVQGTSDSMVTLSSTSDLDVALCHSGANVYYRTFPGESHDSVLFASNPTVASWVNMRFQNRPAHANCPKS